MAKGSEVFFQLESSSKENVAVKNTHFLIGNKHLKGVGSGYDLIRNVADPGSGAFLPQGSRIRMIFFRIPDLGSRSLDMTKIIF
jgi:hypothetical protein